MPSNMRTVALFFALIFVSLVQQSGVRADGLGELHAELGSASVVAAEGTLTVATGVVERTWRWTGCGLVTTGLRHLPSGQEWASDEPTRQCDWSFPGVLEHDSPAEIVGLSAHASTDNGFTSEHLRIVAEVRYSEARLAVRYVIRAYPGAQGLRTQLQVKALEGFVSQVEPAPDALFDSGVMRRKTKPRAVDVSVKGEEYLRLLVTGGGDDIHNDHANWADARLIGRQGREVYLDELEPHVHRQEWGELQNKRSVSGSPIKIAGQRFEHGLGTHAHSEIVFKLDGEYDRFRAQVGVDEGHNGSVRFLVDTSPARWNWLGGTGPEGAVDYVPVAVDATSRRAIGYYAGTQDRNSRETEILREEVKDKDLSGEEVYDWASVLCLEREGEGLCLVKESHKCVNQDGHRTGAFHCGADGVMTTGWGIERREIVSDRFRKGWAQWCVLYSGGDDERELALKRFDRARYPMDLDRDLYIMANTWGSTAKKRVAQSRASEDNVLKEIKSQADLGIDVQQIDDGWQGNDYDSWRPIPERYPEGWLNVRKAAAEHGITLGLWAVGQRIPLENLKWNYDHGDFRYYKLDFINLRSLDAIEALMGKVRDFILYADHKTRVNWDVTERSPRIGYYWAREYGKIYLENRKPVRPAKVVYTPYLVLRDAWQVSKYLNLNQFQITVQNIDRVNRKVSDAYLHNHPYCVAITLMGSPIFFQETQYYDESDREQIRPLLRLYKKHRREMNKGYVFPIGEKPDNASWAGFQCHNPQRGSGYVTLFRERKNEVASRQIALRFLGGESIKITDLRTGDSRRVSVPQDGRVDFQIERAPDFLFCRYKLLD